MVRSPRTNSGLSNAKGALSDNAKAQKILHEVARQACHFHKQLSVKISTYMLYFAGQWRQ
jgi:hypothetical protein